MRNAQTITARQSFLAWRLCKISLLFNFLLALALVVCAAWGIYINPPHYLAADNRLHYDFLKPGPKPARPRLVDTIFTKPGVEDESVQEGEGEGGEAEASNPG